jgi:phage-related minor tail protein
MSDLGSAQLTTEVDLSGLEKGLGDAETQTQSRLGGMAEGLKGSLGLAFAGIGVALAGALVGAGVAAVDMAAQFRDTQGQMQAQLGVTAEEAGRLGDVAREVFGNNFGDSVEDVGQSIIEVRQQMKGLSDEELAGATEAALSLRDAFGFEVTESTNAANLLMEKFSLTSQQAFDFITKGQQAGLNTSGDFLETITEYGGLMSDNGFAADEFFSLMETGLQGGVLGTDKAIDAFKEFGIIIQSIPDTLVGPDGALRGVIPDEEINRIFDGLKDGSVTVQDAFSSLMPVLQGIEDPIQQNALGVAMFGTMWEDMGADAMLALSTTTTGMADMEGATTSLNAQYTSLGGVWEGVTRGFLLALEPLGVMILDLANAAMPYLLAGAEQLRAGIEISIGFIGPFVQGVIAFLSGLLTGEGTASLGTWGAAFTQAQELINGVMTAIMGIVQPILSILSAFWAQHGAEIIAFAQTAWTTIGAIVAGVLEILQATIIPYLTMIGKFISEHSDEIMAVLTAAWEIIQALIGTALAGIQSVIAIVMAIISGDWGRVWTEIQAIATRSIQASQTIVSAAVDIIKAVLTSLADLITGALAGALTGIQSTFSTVWGAIKTGISGPIDTIKAAIQGLIDMLGGALKGAVDAAAGVFAPLQSALNNVKEAAGNLIAMVGDLIAKLAKLVIPGALKEKSPSPFEQSVNHLAEAMRDGLLPQIDQLVGSLSLQPTLGGLSGQLDAAMAGPLGGGSSASAQADVSVRLNEGAMRGLIDVQIDKRLNETGRDAATRRRTGG